MLELEQAQKQILSLVQPLGQETVPLVSALRRTLAENLTASQDLPAFDNSAMDGYAVRAEDVAKASASTPVPLRLVGQVAAGESFAGELAAGECLRLFTGSPLPHGANAVVMQEATRLAPATAETALILDAVKPGENVRRQGEDVKRGVLLFKEGTRLTTMQIGLLAASGWAQVSVRRRPVLGIIATGSELREPGQTLAPGQIYESNRITLAALARDSEAEPRIYPLVPDEFGATQASLATAFSECDAVVTSGGVSVGEKDLVKAAFERLGGKLDFWRVAIKPGKPFALGVWRGKALFGLPGNPVSAFVTFLLLVRPALLKFQAATELGLPVRPGLLQDALVNNGDRRHFFRVHLDPAGRVWSAGTQASHALHSLARSNGLVDVPPNSALQPGTLASVLTWE